MSDFNWDNVLKPKDSPGETTETHIDPRTGLPVQRSVQPETKGATPPSAQASEPEAETRNPLDISSFIPKMKYNGPADYDETLKKEEVVEDAPPVLEEFATPVPNAFGPKDDTAPVTEVAEAKSATDSILDAIPTIPVVEKPAPAAAKEPVKEEVKAPPAASAESKNDRAEYSAPAGAETIQKQRAAAFEGQPERPKNSYGDEFDDVRRLLGITSDTPKIGDRHIDEVLHMSQEKKASDIHFTVGLPPLGRIDGELAPLGYQPLTMEDTRRLIYDVLSDEQIEKFERTHELDFGYTVKGLARFRFNVYMQRGSVAGALRAIPNKIPSFDSLALPPVIRDLSKRSSGLILVTGPTGSGKSTTIATMIDDINESRPTHIMTIEDPIEYLHRHKRSMVNQREMHSDTYSFHNALRAILREDPDIILVGELRDLETIEAALTLAETGHLVFGTLHTRNAPSTIDRIVDVFPADQQSQIRVLLGNTLEAVISQQLLPKLGGGRRAAIEIMIGTPAIKNLIREGKTHQMYSILETSKNQGMITMDHSLGELYRSGNCSFDECLMRAVDRETFVRLSKSAA
ncbi:MAG: PilT/PilU family type 4a pilus ATPase [Chthonomonas sp.]|nr:PilT/PilU family type 4a pilus ATPase [Chthonomonas sp.]